MEFVEDATGCSTCVRTGFLSSRVSASAQNAYSERDDFEDGTSSALKAILEEAANDGTIDSIFESMTGASSPSTSLTQFAMEMEPPANVATANDCADRCGEREEENSPWQESYAGDERMAPTASAPDHFGSTGGADVSLQTHVPFPAPSSPCGELFFREEEDVELNAFDLNSRAFSFPANGHEEKALSLEKDQAGILDGSRAAAVDSQTVSGPVGSRISSVQDVACRLDSIDIIGRANQSMPVEKPVVYFLQSTLAAIADSQQMVYSTPLDGEEFLHSQFLRSQYGVCAPYGVWRNPAPNVLSHGAVENFFVSPATYPTSIRPPLPFLMPPNPERETDPFQRDGPDCPPVHHAPLPPPPPPPPPRLSKLAQAFHRWCEKSGKERAKLRVCFIPRLIIEGRMTVTRESNGCVSLSVEQYSDVANLWFEDRKGRDSYDFNIALKKTFKPFDDNVTVHKINGDDGRKFVFSEKLTRKIDEELDELEKASPSAANHGQNDLPQAAVRQDCSVTSERRSRASGGRTKRRQSRTTHKRSSSYKYTPRPSKGKMK